MSNTVGRAGRHKACPYRRLWGWEENAVCVGVRGQAQGLVMRFGQLPKKLRE